MKYIDITTSTDRANAVIRGFFIRYMKFIKILFGLLILAVIGVSLFSYWMYSSLNTAHEHAKSSEYIKIEKGSSPREIIAKLTTDVILLGELPTLVYLKTLGDPGKLQAGEFQFVSPITPLQVLKTLEKGEERTIKLTIPEGFTRFDIAKRLAEKFPFDPL